MPLTEFSNNLNLLNLVLPFDMIEAVEERELHLGLDGRQVSCALVMLCIDVHV